MKRGFFKKRTIIFIMALFLYSGSVYAKSSFLNNFNTAYPDSASDNNASCQLCHGASTKTLNEYGWGLHLNGINFGALEEYPSVNINTDTTFLEEINANSQPGWTTGANNNLYDIDQGLMSSHETPPDGIGDLDPAAANEPPVATGDEYTMEEDQQLNVPAPGVLGNDSDPDGDSITAFLVEDVKNGTLTLNDNGSFNYNPKLDFFGTDFFTYKADDGQLTSETVTVTITVNNINDNPLADAGGPYSGSVGLPVSMDGSGSFDSDGTIVSYEWDFGDKSTGTGINPSHTYQTSGPFNITLRVTDNDGATDTATTTVEIAENNQPPLAADDAYTTGEDTQFKVTVPGVLGNDSDPDGDPLTAVLVSNTSNGNVTLNSDGSFTYNPDLNFAGTDHFTYVTNDGQLDSNSIATVSITVNPVNDAPVAVDDNFLASEATQLNITGQNVLSNDSDPDGDPISAILVDDVANGSLTLNEDGTFTYDPNPDFFGEDSFTYYATDGQLDSEVATATITVNPPEVVDLEIAGFRVTKRVSLQRGKTIQISLVVRNKGSVNAIEKRPVTVEGMQNGAVVVQYEDEVSAGGKRTSLSIGPYTPVAVGDIMWTVTIHDDDPVDPGNVATAVTKVVK